MLPDAGEAERVASSDGVEVVVHHLANGAPEAPLLIAHATGFHGRAYTPMANELVDEHDVWALDFRGHGATAVPPGWNVDWDVYGNDAVAAAVWLAASVEPGTLVGFGHSMGGATLLMTAHRHPNLFGALVLYEPIVLPSIEGPLPIESPLVAGARRRRPQFASFDEALANFASKPPMNRFRPDALEAYVYGGLTPVDPGHPEGAVRLCCEPEHEAATFLGSRGHHVWDVLSEIETPTMVIGGHLESGDSPANIAEAIADRLPAGRYELVQQLDHFGPFTDPPAVADLIRKMLRQ